MKTKVCMIFGDHNNLDWKKNDLGFVDGYVQNQEGIPFAVICLDKNNKFIMAQLNQFERFDDSEYILK